MKTFGGIHLFMKLIRFSKWSMFHELQKFLTFHRIVSCCKRDEELGHLVNVIDSMKLLLTNSVTGGRSNTDSNIFRKERRKHLTHFLEFHTFATECSPWDRHLERYQYYTHTPLEWDEAFTCSRQTTSCLNEDTCKRKRYTHTLVERAYTREIHNFIILIGCLSTDLQCNVYLISIYSL